MLVLCVSNNSLGQTAAETANGTADFQQLRLRDKVRTSGCRESQLGQHG